MNALQLFKFNENEVRVFINENNEPEFCAKDITRILGYTNGPKTILDHCKSPGITKRYIGVQTGVKTDGSPSVQNIAYSFISEGNLYRLIAKSEKPEAEKFESWVFDEVLPSIRKHGAFMSAQTIEKVLTDPDTIIQLATSLKVERQKRELAEQKVNFQSKELEKAAPKVEYYDTVLQSESVYTTTQIAKELGIGAPTLNQTLKKLLIQYKQNGQWLLSYTYQDKSYTKTRTFSFTRQDGSTGTSI